MSRDGGGRGTQPFVALHASRAMHMGPGGRMRLHTEPATAGQQCPSGAVRCRVAVGGAPWAADGAGRDPLTAPGGGERGLERVVVAGDGAAGVPTLALSHPTAVVHWRSRLCHPDICRATTRCCTAPSEGNAKWRHYMSYDAIGFCRLKWMQSQLVPPGLSCFLSAASPTPDQTHHPLTSPAPAGAVALIRRRRAAGRLVGSPALWPLPQACRALTRGPHLHPHPRPNPSDRPRRRPPASPPPFCPFLVGSLCWALLRTAAIT